MWDLPTLRGLNDRAVALFNNMRSKSNTPLGSLALLLNRGRPPSVGILLSLFNNAEDYVDFVNLVKEYLPERQGEILSEVTPSAQMARFASYFEDRYLPLEPAFKDGMLEDDYSYLTRSIPVTVMGMTWEDYESLNDYRLGMQLMSFLVESPTQENNVRISLADGFPDAYRCEAERLPPGGVRLNSATQVLNGKKWIGLKIWAEILHQETGNWFLDTDTEMLYSGMINEWDKETVELMAEDWKKAQALWERAVDFANWLEDDKLGPARFKQTVDFLLSHLNAEDYAGS